MYFMVTNGTVSWAEDFHLCIAAKCPAEEFAGLIPVYGTDLISLPL
jgi:hypothetical protein